MRYAVFTDIHANLEAMEAVLAKIDEIAKEKPIDHLWFLGDLVGYGPNPNECIDKLRERTEVIIAGNHDWAAVGKIDLEDFSAAARISAEWTAEQLTDENKTFLANLPERIELGECTLVHGSPYGPLWEYLTSAVLAERSFQHFSSRFCFVGHTHVPVIFQQSDPIANAPTLPLVDEGKNGLAHHFATDEEYEGELEDNSSTAEDTDETAEIVVIQPPVHTNTMAATAESAFADPTSGKPVNEEEANSLLETRQQQKENATETTETDDEDDAEVPTDILENSGEQENEAVPHDADSVDNDAEIDNLPDDEINEFHNEQVIGDETGAAEDETANTEDHLNSEIEELLSLLGLTESMISVTNEMILPPVGHWNAPQGMRAIINPGGVGQPRDGNPRAAFMIYDTEAGFEFYRIPYEYSKTQEKIIKAGLPTYLAVRLAYGR